MSTTPTKPRADWEAIERMYRADLLSIREIAKLHSVSDTAIRKKAAAEHWQRDLSKAVAEKVRTDLVRTEVRTANPQTDREIVVEAAAQVVHIVMGQRTVIQRMKGICLSLLEELDEQTIGRELYADLGEMLRSEDDKGQDKRNDLYMKIISGAGRVDSMKKLAETMKILIALERQAFNISDEPAAPADALSAFFKTISDRGSRLPIRAEDAE